MDGSKGSSKKRVAIRANPAQTVMLRGAFTRSNVLSPEELKTLSERTGLPENWIHLWFGRQRVKARKLAVDLRRVTSSSDLVPSPQEILEVKMEYRDSLVPRSSSPALPVASVIGPASDENISQSEKAPVLKKARVSHSPSQKAKKRQTPVRHNLVKAEFTDLVGNTLGNSTSAPPSMAQNSVSCDISHPPCLNEGPFVIPTTFPLSRLAPPSRTALTSANILAHPRPGEDRQSGLSTNQSYRIYSPLGTSDVTTVNLAGSQHSPSVFKSSKAAAVYQQGPRFHTHFYNNGPANYRNTRPNLGTLPALRSNHITGSNLGLYMAEPMLPVSNVSGRQNIPERVGLGEYFSQSLAPAFVLENTFKPTPSFVVPMNDYSAYTSSSSMQYIGSSTISEDLPYPPYYSNHEENHVKADPEDLDISAQCNLLLSPMEASQMFPTVYNEALDPSRAPLKHLTDVLGRFRDQDGTYTKLVDLEEREGLMNCLLDDDLARRSPFQAAMGLVLLSKLGLEWDY